MKVKVLMLKTACGPGFSYNAGSTQILDDDTAGTWAYGADPVCKIILNEQPVLKEINKEEVNISVKELDNSHQNSHQNEEKQKIKPSKYRPGVR